MSSRIAVFDSGVGGLTVLAAVRGRLPGCDYVYLGDTARVPYGTKSGEVVRGYALEAAWFLIERHAPAALVVACNSAAAVALPLLRARYPGLPVLGVVEPGARAAVEATKNRRVAVLATEGTVRSGAYGRAIAELDSEIQVLEIACPLFVPLAEEGWGEDEVARLVARRYLEPALAVGVDTVVLGCTHYPLLRETIAAVVGPDVAIVDSATPLAQELAAQVSGGGRESGALRVYTTDYPERLLRIGARFFGEPVTDAERIDLEALARDAGVRTAAVSGKASL